MSKWRILAVDDDADILQLITETLKDEYDVLTLTKSTDFHDVLPLFEPDLIILDILMPKINGYQVIDFLKKNKKYASVPVIFLSAKSTHQDLKKGYTVGANLYLTKPFQPARLRKNVDLIFERTPPPEQKKSLSVSEVKNRLEYQSTKDLTGARHDTRVVRPEDEDDEDEDDKQQTTWLG